jgi:ABC-2 type transport system ATP-binding protein
VLDGEVLAVKESRGTRSVALAVDGGAQDGVRSVLQDRRLVTRADDQNRFFEIELAPGADPQELLRRVVATGAQVKRFELISPSLHQIFLERVGATGVEEGMSGHG